MDFTSPLHQNQEHLLMAYSFECSSGLLPVKKLKLVQFHFNSPEEFILKKTSNLTKFCYGKTGKLYLPWLCINNFLT